VVVGASYVIRNEVVRAKIDSVTLCPMSGATGALATLLDLTDPLTTSQSLRLRQILDAEFGKAPSGWSISAGIVSADSSNWGSQFSRCKPLSEGDANPLIQNPKMIGERYNDDFLVPLSGALETMIDRTSEDRSPILESLQALIADGKSFGAVKGPRSLIVVSDLIQHSEVLSFYRGQSWSDFEASENYARLARNLQDVDIILVKVPRTSSRVSQDDVEDFWARYFDVQGANAKFKIHTLGDI